MESKIVKPLTDLQMLEDEDREVRLMAIEALELACDPRAVKPLIKSLLKDKSPNVRAASAWALGVFGDLLAVEPLIQALEDEDGEVRCAA